jgi:hypothetical protein
MLAVLGDGSVVGSLDPELDTRLAAEALRALAAGGGRCVTLPWRGAETTVFVEGFPPPRRLFVAGATQIAAALAKLARPLGHHGGRPAQPFAPANGCLTPTRCCANGLTPRRRAASRRRLRGRRAQP